MIRCGLAACSQRRLRSRSQLATRWMGAQVVEVDSVGCARRGAPPASAGPSRHRPGRGRRPLRRAAPTAAAPLLSLCGACQASAEGKKETVM
jgi:hypothetical protein